MRPALGPIPRIIHQMWIGSSTPPHIQRYMGSWMTHHPGWSVWHWRREDLEYMGLANWELFDRAMDIAPQSPYQFQADVARYEILFRHGGVWVDADFECQKPIDDMMGNLAWMAWEKEGVWLNNAIMGMPAEHSLMVEAINGLGQNILDKHPASNSVLSGPQYITPLALQSEDPIKFVAKDLFFPYLWNELDRGNESFPNAYAVHHWNNRRVREERPR